MAKRTTYHHGDLRRALLDASIELIDEVGMAALSLREVARKAGVSHNAPYHHFPDKSSLLAAIAKDGFATLGKEIAAARAVAGDSGRARLEACGVAYVRFAVRSPAHFRVMFRPELAAPEAHPGVTTGATLVFDTLVKSVTEAQAAGDAPPGDPIPLVLTCWSCVHGLATLWLDGPLSRDPKGFGKSPEKLAATVAATIASLLASAAGDANYPAGARAGGPGGKRARRAPGPDRTPSASG
jgi:AcrR family transcriptional regulator